MAEERVRRRLAAILAADVVGYGRLMEQDESGTFLQLRSCRKELFELYLRRSDRINPWTRYRLARVVKLLIGLGIALALAGAGLFPLLHTGRVVRSDHGT